MKHLDEVLKFITFLTIAKISRDINCTENNHDSDCNCTTDFLPFLLPYSLPELLFSSFLLPRPSPASPIYRLQQVLFNFSFFVCTTFKRINEGSCGDFRDFMSFLVDTSSLSLDIFLNDNKKSILSLLRE